MATQSPVTARGVPREVMDVETFLRLPEIKPPLEFLQGRIIQKMSPNLPHSIISLQFANRLNVHAAPRKLGLAVIEVRYCFGGESLVPDVSFLTRERIPKDRLGRYAERIDHAPDLAIEVLSPGQTVKQLAARLTRCVRNGVRLAWLVQPRRNRVFVFRPGQPPLELGPGDVLQGYDVLPEFTLSVDELFGWLVAED